MSLCVGAFTHTHTHTLTILFEECKLACFGNVTVKFQFSVFAVLNEKAEISIQAEFEALPVAALC